MFCVVMLPHNSSAEVQYQDLHLVPSYLKAHGILMGLAFVVFFPMGTIMVRTMNFKGIVWAHAACQLVGWILMIAGLAMGTRVATIIDIVSISFVKQ